jgi:hypothetical protein
MVVIIGAGTTVTSDKISSGFVSVSFNLAPQVERLFQLGSFNAFDTNVTTQESASITNYGGASSTVALAPSTSCADSTAKMDITITPAPCSGAVDPIIRTGATALFITGFSYSKDYQGYGQESWSLTGKPIIEGFTGSIAYIQGFAEGNRITGSDIVSDDGLVLVDSETGSTGQVDATGRNLSVSAGSPGLGNDDDQDFGRAIEVGGGVGKEDGKRGTSSASIPHQLIFF